MVSLRIEVANIGSFTCRSLFTGPRNAIAWVIAAFLFPLLSFAQAPSTQAGEAVTLRLDSLMAVGMRREHIAGAAFVLVSDGRIVASHGFGFADIATRRRVNPDSTTFGLASTTKLFTAIAAARLARDGRLDLDAPIAPYVSGTPLAGRTEGVTVSKLLTHTAGYDDPTIGSSARAANALLPLNRYLERSLTPPWIAPGSATSYSNLGVALAGHVMSVAANSKYDALVESMVFAPFGMHNSSVAQPLPSPIELQRAVAYSASGDDQAAVPRIFFNDAPASAGFATPHDMGLLMQSLLSPSNPGDSAVAATLFSRRFTNHPALPGMSLGFRESMDGDDIYEHGGDWQDYSNSLYLDRKSRSGLFVVFSNGEGGRTARELWSAVRGTLPARPARFVFTQQTSAPATSRCSDIAGTYRDTRMSRHTLARLGVLTGDVPEVSVKTVAAGITVNGRAYSEFGGGVFQGDSGRTVAFRCEKNGRPTYLFRGIAPASSYRRLDAVDTRAVQGGLLGLAFLGTVLGIFADIRRRRVRTSGLDTAARSIRLLASAAVIVLLLGLLVLLVTTSQWDFQYGVPETIANLQKASPGVAIAVGFAIILSALAVVTAKAKAGIVEIILTISPLLLLLLMFQWNLIAL